MYIWRSIFVPSGALSMSPMAESEYENCGFDDKEQEKVGAVNKKNGFRMRDRKTL